MLHFRNSALALLVTASLASSASAAVVISDSSTLGTTNIALGSEQVSVDGVTVTFSARTVDNNMQVDGDGIFLQGAGDLLDVTFNTNVTVTGYTIGFNNSSISGNIEFYVDNGTSYFENGITVGSYTLATPLVVNTGQVLTLNGNMNDVSQLKSLTFVVPEPSSLTLLALGAFPLLKRTRRTAA